MAKDTLVQLSLQETGVGWRCLDIERGVVVAAYSSWEEDFHRIEYDLLVVHTIPSFATSHPKCPFDNSSPDRENLLSFS